jgi:DNA-binding IclR family transcriptional regulator
VLKDDYATTVEEMSLGACSVAVPIRSGSDVVASVGIVVPTLKRDRAKLVAAMQVTARSVGRTILDPSTSVDRFH